MRHRRTPASFRLPWSTAPRISLNRHDACTFNTSARKVSGSGHPRSLARSSGVRHSGRHVDDQDSANVISKLHQWTVGGRICVGHAREPQSGESGRRHRCAAAFDARGCERRGGGGARRVRPLAAGARAATRRAPLSRRGNPGGTERGIRANDDARDGEDSRRDPRRRAGSHRHELPDGRRGPSSVRADSAVGTAREVRDVDPSADRRLRHDHRLEFSDRGAVVEDPAGAGVRQHSGIQAGRRGAAFRRQLRPGPPRCGAAARRAEPGAWRRPGHRRAAGVAPRRERHFLHGLDRDRTAREPGLRLDVQESASRDGRQERDSRDGRCRSGAGRRRGALGRLWHQRPAVHRRQPCRRPPQGARRIHRGVRRARPTTAGRRRARAIHADGPERQRGAAVARGRIRENRPGRRCERWPSAATA